MFDNLFTFAGTTGTAGMLLAMLLTLNAVIAIGLMQRAQRERPRSFAR
jgi:hypothetical protein